MIVATFFTMPLLTKKAIDLPPIVSVELIQISEKTNLPFAPKAKEILEKVKKEEERIVSQQAPPAEVKKEKPDKIPLPNETKEEKKKDS